MPVAHAGEDATYHVFDTIQLDGRASQNPQEGTLRYRWTQTGGESVEFDASSPNPNFAARQPGTFVFELAVSNGTATSAPDEVTIEVASYEGQRAVFGSRKLTHALPATEETPKRMVVENGIVCLVRGEGGVDIVDVRGGKEPELLRSIPTNGSVEDVVLADGVAYVAAGEAGLMVIDLTNPHSIPAPVTKDTRGHAWQVAVSGQTAFVADGEGGLSLIDVSNTAVLGEPIYVDVEEHNADDVRKVVVDGNHAYAVSDTERGFFVIDISNLATPRVASRVAKDASVGAIFVRDGIAYVLVDDHEVFRTYKVSDPDQSIRLGQLTGECEFRGQFDVTVVEDTAYLVCSESELLIVDVADQKQFQPPVRVGLEGGIRSVSVHNNKAYVSAKDGLLTVVDMHKDESSDATIGIATNGVFAVDGDTLYLADDRGGVSSIDVAQMFSSGSLFHRIVSSREIYDVDIVSGHAYFTGFGIGLRVFDVNDPMRPQELLSFSEWWPSYKAYRIVSVVGTRVYIASDDHIVSLIDIADPGDPQATERTWIADYSTVVGGLVYAITYADETHSWLTVSDVFRSEEQPVQIKIPPASMLEVKGELVYLPNEHGLAELDVGRLREEGKLRPENNSVEPGDALYQYEASFGYGGTVHGDLAFVTGCWFCESGNPQIIDLRDRTAPARDIDIFARSSKDRNKVGNASQMVSWQDHLYILHNEGVQIFDVVSGTPLEVGRYALRMFGGTYESKIAAEGTTLGVVTGGQLTIVQTPTISLSPRVVRRPVGSLLRYTVQWTSLHPARKSVLCEVTGGECNVGKIDQQAQTVTVTWQLPNVPGDYEFAVAAGNDYYSAIGRDRIQVTEN